MMRLLSILGLTLFLVAPRTADAQVLLRFKVLEGVSARLVMETNTQQTLTLTVAGNEMDVVTGSKQRRTMSTKNGSRDGEGKIRVEQAIQDLEANLSLPTGDIQFNSKDEDHARTGGPMDLLIDILEASANASWTLIHDEDGRVVAVEGAKKALEGLSPEARLAVEQQFDADYLKDQANTRMDVFPDTPVNAGDTWRRSSEVRLDSGQSLTFTTDYEYKGTTDSAGKQLDRIAVEVKEVSYSIDENAPTPLRLVDSELQVDSSEGYILFDRTLGQVIEQQDKIRITGSITFSAAGMEIPGKLDLTMENRVKRD